jgi:hypothetical protein
MSQEHARAVEHVQSVRMAVAWTSASTQVAIEALKRTFGQIAQRKALSISPVDEVLGRSDMPAGRDLRVASLRQRLRESLKERAGRPGTKRLNPQSRIEKL